MNHRIQERVFPYLDLSTNHTTQATAALLAAISSEERCHRNWPAMTVAPYEYGCFVTVPDLVETPEERFMTLPQDLALVLLHARGLGCTVVRFDSCADVIEALPTHDW